MNALRLSEILKPSQLIWSLVLLATLLAAFTLSWNLHRQYNYGYGFWYDQMQIGEHIQKYGAQNRYIRGFNGLDKTTYTDLFAQIVDAVHSQGKGLAEIRFTDKRGVSKPLLREPEITHLQDVANLIDTLTMAGGLAVLFAGIGSLLLVRRKIPVQLKPQLTIFGGLIGLLILLTLIIGPERVFYQFHVWVFPDDHQWFFFYQESLMSTMMKAPDLFGGIAVSITALGLLLFAGFVILLTQLTGQRNTAAHQ